MLDALTPSDAAVAASLSQAFGWPHREADWSWFLHLGQGVAWREDGLLLGTAMMFPLDAGHGSIALVLVSQALQKRGIGRRLTEAAMALGAGRSLKLHATAAGAGLYTRLGFEPRGVVQQWQGVVGAGIDAPRMAAPSDFVEICTLDRAATGLQRTTLLRALFAAGPTALSGPAGALSGYAMRRQFGRGALIGPIVARDAAEAGCLVAGLQRPGFMRLDTPADAGLIEALGTAGLASVEDVQVMVRGAWPAHAGAAPFGLASQALG